MVLQDFTYYKETDRKKQTQVQKNICISTEFLGSCMFQDKSLALSSILLSLPSNHVEGLSFCCKLRSLHFSIITIDLLYCQPGFLNVKFHLNFNSFTHDFYFCCS